MKTASYTKTPQGDGFLFNVTPAPKIMGGCSGVLLILMVGFLGGAIGFGIGHILEYGQVAFATIVSLSIIIWGFIRDPRKKNHHNPSSFSVNSNEIEVNGQRIVKADIHRIIIKNTYDRTPQLQLTGQTISTGAGMGHDIRNALEQISFSLDIEAGGHAIQLAGGLDGVTANGLLTDVSRILGFS